MLLELLEGHLVARRYVHLLANFRGNAPETAWRRMSGELRFTAFKGEAISKISAGSLGGDDYYQISAIVEEAMLLKVVDSLRAVGCTDILVFDLGYIFDTRSQHYQLLIEKLKRQRRGGDSDPDNSDP